MIQPKTRNLPIETRAASVSSVDAEARTFVVIFTTGAGVERRDFWSDDRYIEELVVSEKAINMERLQAGAPFLDSHRSRGSVAEQLGVVERAWVEKGQGLAEIRFPKEGVDLVADAVFAKIYDRILRSVSVGYLRNKIEVDKSKSPNIWRVTRWTPYEISMVTIPADHKAQVRDAQDDEPCEFQILGTPSAAVAARSRMRLALNRMMR
jgi:hypothetical protein